MADISFAKARRRVVVGFALGVVVFAIVMVFGPWQLAAMLGWSAAAGAVEVWTVGALWGYDSRQTAAMATREDDSRVTADVVLVSAAVASLLAVGGALLKAAHLHGLDKAGTMAAAVVAVVTSWALVHMVYTLRYAHLFYARGGGVSFNEDSDPDYRDFAYLALTVGMTFQVSDTNITSKAIRRAVTRHALLSYLFGAVVVAMSINVVASLLSK
jgi:uncharacterized membrane protein